MKAKAKPIRILALDISASPGFAVLEAQDGKAKLIYEGSVKTSTDMTDSERFAYVEAETIKTVYEQGPFDYVCRENFIKGGNKRATQLVFGSWAAIDSGLGRFGYYIPSHKDSPFEITNSRIKALVGGHGGDDKDVVAEGAKKLLGLPPEFKFKSNDASDAAAIGYTFLYDFGLLDKGVAKDGKTSGKT